MTGSDNETRGPGRRIAHAGPGMAPRFMCGACGRQNLPTTGRRLKRVQGLRQCVCLGCAEKRKAARNASLEARVGGRSGAGHAAAAAPAKGVA